MNNYGGHEGGAGFGGFSHRQAGGGFEGRSSGGGYEGRPGSGFEGRSSGGGRPDRYYSVSEVNRYINGLMKPDPLLQDIWVCGEVSNYRPHYSGHMYFTLKDSTCAIHCVMFRGAASRLKFNLENGQNVFARGGVSVFERDGQYQLYCEEIHTDGVGDLYTAFEQMKKKLADEGLFDQALKKALPLLPQSVCVITSPTGSVIRDIINVSLRRFPMAAIKLAPVQVQGAAAAPQIAHAIELVNAQRLADVIVVARGGGSIEDLWAFNEECVARAIAGSEIPVVSAVGHETDFTISDFVSDLRAPTPSAAAELVFPDAGALRARVGQSRRLLRQALLNKNGQAKRRLERCVSSVVFTKPANRVDFARMRLNGAEDKLLGAMRSTCERGKARAALLAARLGALSPLATLSRGYAVVTGATGGELIKSVADTGAGQRVCVRLSDGALQCDVVGVDVNVGVAEAWQQ